MRNNVLIGNCNLSVGVDGCLWCDELATRPGCTPPLAEIAGIRSSTPAIMLMDGWIPANQDFWAGFILNVSGWNLRNNVVPTSGVCKQLKSRSQNRIFFKEPISTVGLIQMLSLVTSFDSLYLKAFNWDESWIIILSFLLSPPTHTHTSYSSKNVAPCPPSSSAEVSGLSCRSAIWAAADKSSCAGPAAPAGLPAASEAWLWEVMGEICGSQGRDVTTLTCWSTPPPPTAAASVCPSLCLTVAGALIRPRAGLTNGVFSRARSSHRTADDSDLCRSVLSCVHSGKPLGTEAGLFTRSRRGCPEADGSLL